MTDSHITPLGHKLAAAILGTTLIALVLVSTLNLFLMLHSHRMETVDRVKALSSLMATSLVAAVDFDDPEAAQENLASLALMPNIFGAAIYTNGEDLFASYGEIPAYAPAQEPSVDVRLSDMLVMVPLTTQTDNSLLIIRSSFSEQWAVLSRYLIVASLIFAGALILSMRMAGYFKRKLGEPVRDLTDAVSDIAYSKDYSRRVRHESDDEIGMLVAGFNSMLDIIEQRDIALRSHQERLEQLVEERTCELEYKRLELLHKNTLLEKEIQRRAKAEMIREEVERINRHDLKSSLSFVMGYPELLLDEGNLTPGQTDKVKRIRAAGYRMLDMICNHLDMFKMEKGIYALNRKSVDLVETLCGLEEEFAPLLASVGVRLGIELDGQEVVGHEQLIVSGEEPLLRAMFRNLIQNGIEASAQGDVVVVGMRQADRAQVSIRNTAPVPRAVRPRIFEKYVTHGKTNGTGLGTYFAALIARTHGATIIMRTNREAGTTMTVSFR